MDSSAIIPSQPGSSVTLAKYLKLFAATQQPSHENLQSALRKFKAYIEAPAGKKEAFLAQMNEGKTVMILHSLWNRVNDDKNLQLTILQTLVSLVRADKETLHSTANDIYTFFVPDLVDILESCVDPSDKSYNSITFFGLCAELLDSHCSGKAGKTTCETLLRNVPLRNRIFALIQMSAALPSAQVQLYILLLSNRLYRYASLIRSGLFTSILETISSFEGITKEDITKISAKVDGSSTNDFRKVAREVRLDASERVRSGVIKLNRETVPNSADAWVEAMKDLSTAGVFSFAADSVVISYKEGDQNVTEPGSSCEFLDLSLLGFGSSVFVKTKSDGKNPKGSLTSDANQQLGAVIVLQHSWPQVTRVSCNVEEQTVSFHTVSDQEASAMTHGRLYRVSSRTDLNLDLTAAYHFPNKAELGSAMDCLHLLLPSTIPLEVSSKPSSKSSKVAKTFKSSEPSESYHAAALASRAAGGLPSTITPLSPSPSDAARSKFGIPIQKAMTTTANATHSEVAHLQNLKAGKTVKISKSGEIRNVAVKSASASAIFQEEEKEDHRANDEEEEEADKGKEEAGAKMDEMDAKDAEIKEKDDDADTADPDAEKEAAAAEKDSVPSKLDVNMEAEDANDIDVAETKPQKVAAEEKEEEEDEDLSAWQQTTHENEPQTSLTQAPAEPERPVQETVATETIASETRVNKSKKKAAKRSSEVDAIDDQPLPARKARGLVSDKVGVYVDQSNEDDAVDDEEGSRKRSRSDRQAKGRTGGDEKIDQAKEAHLDAKAKVPKGRTGKLLFVTGATKPSGTIAGIVNSKGTGSSKQHPQALTTTATTKKSPFAAQVLPPRPPPPPPPQASSANKSALKPPGATFKSAEKPGSDQFDFDENDKKDKLTKTKIEKKKEEEQEKDEDEEDDDEKDVNPSSTKKSKLSDAAIAAEAFVPLTSSSGKYVTPALQLSKSSLHPKVPAVKEKDKKSKLYDNDNAYEFDEIDGQDIPQPAALTSKPSKPAGKAAAAAAAAAAALKPSPQELQTGKRRAKEMAAQKTDKAAAAAASEAATEATTAAVTAAVAAALKVEEKGPKSMFAPTTVAETEIEEAEKEVEDEKKKKMMKKKKKEEEVVVAMDDDDSGDREDVAPYHHPVDDKPRKRAKTDASHQADLQKKKTVEDDSPVQPSVSVVPTKAAAETKQQPLFSKLESKSSHSTAPPMTSSTKKKNKLKMDEEAATREKPVASAYSGVGVMEEGSQIMNPIPFGLDEDVHFAAIGLDNTAASAVVSASSAEPERQMSELLASDNEGGQNNNDDDDDDDHDRQLRAALREQCEDILDSLSKTLDHHEKRLLATLERDELSGLSVPQGADMSLDDARDTIPNYVEAIEKAIAKAESIFKAGTVRFNATVAECEAFMKKQASQLRKVETSYKEQVSAIDQHRAEMTAFADGLVKSTAKAAERAVAEFKTKEAGLKADYKKFTEKINKKKRLSEETIKGFF